MKLVDELNEVLKEKEKVNAEGVLLNKEAKGKVSRMIQDLTSYKLNDGGSHFNYLNSDYAQAIFGFLLPKNVAKYEGECDSCSNFGIQYTEVYLKGDLSKHEVKLMRSTSGSFGLNDIYQVERTRVEAKILDILPSLQKYLDDWRSRCNVVMNEYLELNRKEELLRSQLNKQGQAN